MKCLMSAILSLVMFSAAADQWRVGKVKELGSGYDGASISFRLYDLSPDSPEIDYSKCTCNASWNTLCLNPARANFDKEYAMLLAAFSAGKNVQVIFNDNACFINALIIPN